MPIMQPIELLTAVMQLEPKEKCLYYEGYIARQRTTRVIALAEEAKELCEQGVVLLATKRVGVEKYHYYAIKAERGEVIPSMIFYAKQRGKNL